MLSSHAHEAGSYKASMLVEADRLANESTDEPAAPATRIRTAAQRLCT